MSISDSRQPAPVADALANCGLGTRTLVMGILNVTPDSFSDGGRFSDPEAAVEHALEMIEAGADLIDIGAESTRPGYDALDFADEWSRLSKVLSKVRAAVTVPLSIDTYKAEIARRAFAAGVEIVNDVWGGRRDPNMYEVVANCGAPYILMHNSTDRPFTKGNIVQAVTDELMVLVANARRAGVRSSQIILDPGVGFGKTTTQNLELINGIDVMRAQGYPVLVGTSRKSVIGQVLGLAVGDRLEGTAATVAVAVTRGADIVRVHDVREMVRLVRMTDALVKPHERS